MNKICVLVLMAVVVAANVTAGERILEAEINVAASVSEVWTAWTTEAGVKSFFAPASNVDLRPDGVYDILFFPDNPAGSRGAEGMRILVVEPEHRFAFTWNASPVWPEVRKQRTVVNIRLTPAEGNRTRVLLSHSGWGEGEDWDAAYDYFVGGWETILNRLLYRFTVRPIDWNNVPEGLWYD